ncbi:MAG TPA: PhnD/SsuA/transferrin family substrate-binding protein [Nitrososphaerales archaeon]|nr:PhnD/SsuA/transferrin family substrate-binding protein [Nitrososphaerales archaeon]
MNNSKAAIARITAVVVIIIVVAAAVVGGLSYYYLSANSASHANPIIRIGTTFGAADTSDVPSVYAMTVLLKSYGYTANYIVFTGQQAAIAALLSGEIDVLQSSPVGPIAAAQKNTNIVAFGSAEDASDEILVCTSNVTSMAQLATQHATVAVTSFTDSSYYYPYVWLSENGYDPNNVNWVFVPGAAGRGAALLSGKIPCGATDVGSTVILLAQPGNKFHIVATLASLIPSIPLNALFTTQSYLGSHHDALVALLEAYINANRWAQNKQDYLNFAPSVIGSQLTPAQLSSAYDILITLNIWNRDQPWNSTITNTIANIMGQFKLGGVTSTPAASSWSTLSLYQEAIGKTGT